MKFVFLLISALIFSMEAEAYLDPGTSSGLISFIVGLSLIGYFYVKRAILQKKRRSNSLRPKGEKDGSN